MLNRKTLTQKIVAYGHMFIYKVLQYLNMILGHKKILERKNYCELRNDKSISIYNTI